MQWKHLKADDMGIVLFWNISSMGTCVQFPPSHSSSPHLGSSHCSSLEVKPTRSITPGCQMRQEAPASAVKPLLDGGHGLTTITWSSLEPWAHFSISFLQNAGLEGVPLPPPFCLRLLSAKWKTSPVRSSQNTIP